MNKSTRSASAERIVDAALRHFSTRGYDGGSLNEIAESVGIRKASLYAHFVGKDDLFLAALDDAVSEELAFVAEAFERPAGDPGAGYEYVFAIAGRYRESVHLRFMVRTVYLVPRGLKGQVTERYTRFLSEVRAAYRHALQVQARRLRTSDEPLFCEAYAGIVESLFVELTYGDAATLEARKTALWRVLQDSIASRSA